MSKLLHKTLRVYVVFSIFVMITGAPIFYFIAEKLFVDEADEALTVEKQEFLEHTLPKFHKSDIGLWNKINRDIKIETFDSRITKDTICFRTIFDAITQEEEPFHILYAPIKIEGMPYIYKAKMNLVESEDLIKSIVILFAMLLLLLLVGLYFITIKLSKQLWKPFYTALHEIENFEIDNHQPRDLIKTTTEEFLRLHSAMSKLIKRNTAIYDSQREFIENAAHELQTPLAIFQAQIDTLMQNPDITREQSIGLEKLTESTARLNRLNKNLLLLSKMERNQYSSFEEININDVILKQLKFFKEQASGKNIALTTNLVSDAILSANPVLFDTAVSNLFLNAIRHNVNGGTIHVELNQRSIKFINSGISVPLQTHKLFSRFSGMLSSSNGSGLGLSIVKKTADLHGWKIEYFFNNNLHVFELQF